MTGTDQERQPPSWPQTLLVGALVSMVATAILFLPERRGHDAVVYALMALPATAGITLLAERMKGFVSERSSFATVPAMIALSAGVAYLWNILTSLISGGDLEVVIAVFAPPLTLTFWSWFLGGAFTLLFSAARTTRRRAYVWLASLLVLGLTVGGMAVIAQF